MSNALMQKVKLEEDHEQQITNGFNQTSHNDSTTIQKKKKRRKKQKIRFDKTSKNDNEMEDDIEIEYVGANFSFDDMDPKFKEFQRIFSKFATPEELTNNVDEKDIKEEETKEEKIKKEDDLDSSSEDEAENQEQKISKKQQKKLSRLSVSQLKQIVTRPDLVEVHDVTAQDPLLLCHLKAYRNTIPVPKHWSQKRKYLQGKRGIEKPPFRLPEFIAKTGISQVRDTSAEKDAQKKTKVKARNKINPILGKMDIDYQILHDAFFRYQTKPKMSIFGDVYHEGKENELRFTHLKPGVLSDRLRQALGMPPSQVTTVPPPWLLNMQRNGPPPSYPNLKIPGLNAPIPDGASWGFQPGGWGKPPMDDSGKLLYGDVFKKDEKEALPPLLLYQSNSDLELAHWGEFDEKATEEENEQEAEEEEEEENVHMTEENDHEVMEPATTTSIPSASSHSGMETPNTIQLRKGVVPQTTSHSSPITTANRNTTDKSLYQIMEQRPTTGYASSSAFPANSYTYALPAGNAIEAAFTPEQLEKMEQNPEAIIQSKYEEEQLKKRTSAARSEVQEVIEEETRKRQKKEQEKKKLKIW